MTRALPAQPQPAFPHYRPPAVDPLKNATFLPASAAYAAGSAEQQQLQRQALAAPAGGVARPRFSDLVAGDAGQLQPRLPEGQGGARFSSVRAPPWG